jgi:glycolate oxidase iron-sulfur subunit
MSRLLVAMVAYGAFFSSVLQSQDRPMDYEHPFVAEIRAQPRDDAPRLIYADYLDEAGDPQGELIRVQVALSHLAPGEPERRELELREDELLSNYADEWLAPLRDLGAEGISARSLQRGLLERVRIKAAAFLKHGDDLCRRAPALHCLELRGVADAMSKLVTRPLPPQITVLDLNASGCGVQVREYGHLLRGDPAYAARAARVSAATRDVVEVVRARLAELPMPRRASGRVAFHPPCTLQHGQRIRGEVEALLASVGATVVPFQDANLCCGSAGTYSLLQPALATELRDRKLAAIHAAAPDVILSANVGCVAHLAGAARVPVRHWIEWLDDLLSGPA